MTKMKKSVFLLAVLLSLLNVRISAQDADPKLVKLMEKSMTIEKFLALPDDEFWKYSKAVLYQNQGFEDGHGMFAWPPALKTLPK